MLSRSCKSCARQVTVAEFNTIKMEADMDKYGPVDLGKMTSQERVAYLQMRVFFLRRRNAPEALIKNEQDLLDEARKEVE